MCATTTRSRTRAYARRGIPHYLIFDPYRQHCLTLWNPGPDGYLGRDTIPYGKQVTVASGIGTLSVDTAALPVDPSAVLTPAGGNVRRTAFGSGSAPPDRLTVWSKEK